MATYVFTFPASAAGRAVTIRDSAGDTVDTDTAGSAIPGQGSVLVVAELPVGSYVATAETANEFYTSRAPGVLDVSATVDGLEGLNETRVAATVDPESVTAAADIIAALIAAGLMAPAV